MKQFSRVNFHPSKNTIYDISIIKYNEYDWYLLKTEVFANEIMYFRTHRTITDTSKEKLKYES